MNRPKTEAPYLEVTMGKIAFIMQGLEKLNTDNLHCACNDCVDELNAFKEEVYLFMRDSRAVKEKHTLYDMFD